jgi:hypothetical protein
MLKNIRAEETHRELFADIYIQNVMSKVSVRQWHIMLKDRGINVHDEELSVGPYVVCHDFVQIVEQNICQRQALQNLKKIVCIS